MVRAPRICENILEAEGADMWRSILAVILLPSLTAAQTQTAPSATPNSSNPALQVTPASQPSYHPYTFYNRIRRGTAEDVAIELFPAGFVTTPTSAVPGIIPLNLELLPTKGFIFSKLRYPKTYNLSARFHSNPIPVAAEDPIQFRVRAGRTASLGSQILTGKLTFQVVHFDSSVGPVEELNVEIPITVVEHNAKVQRASWPAGRLSPAMIVLIIVLLPVEIPVALLILAGCAVSPRSCPD